MKISPLYILKLFLLILFLLTGFSSLIAQEVRLQGNVNDSTQNPIPYTNLVATPLGADHQISFAITDERGRYKLQLLKNIEYNITITHMGFFKYSDTVQLTSDTWKDYSLKRSIESLEEVIIEQEMAVLVKEDTITYRTDQFRTGEERKLREILKNLPGIEVDRAGNVTVNGKKVTKFMVEGKTFFTGDTKLGVNNIPADAVDEVEALDNYNEVSFLKGLDDSDRMALNIKLKAGKKKFLFGDLEAGGGIEKRYVIHPTLFFYSPKTAINAIIDINNIGEKSFTIQDYIDFEGGFASMLDGSTSFGDVYNSDFAQFLNQENFIYQKNDFGAGSVSQQINSKLRLEAFSIVNKGRTQTLTDNNLIYLSEENLNEFRETSQEKALWFSLNKLKLRYQPQENTDIAYEAFIKTSTGDAQEKLISLTAVDTTLTRIYQQPENFSVNQEVRYNKQFSYKHTSTLTANYFYSEQESNNDWLFNQPVFSSLIPFQPDGDFYNLLQNTATQEHKAVLDLKHYWVINNYNHLNPKVGFAYNGESFSTTDRQLLQDGSSNTFEQRGFNNNLKLGLIDYYVGLQYKAKAGDFIFKPGIFFHSYLWKVSQFSKVITDKTKSIGLPELKIDYEISSAENIKFDYQLNTGFSNASQYANRLRLISFNQLFRGNENLENQLFHSASLRYRQFNLYKGLILNAKLHYIKRVKSVRNIIQIEGINQVNTSVYTNLPENTYSFTGSFTKRIAKYRLTLRGNINLFDYSRIINGAQNSYQSHNYHYTAKVETRFREWPNIEIGWEQSFTNYKNPFFTTRFTQVNPYALLEWDFLNDFIFKADYSYNYYQNRNTEQINRFELGNFSLFYNKEDSPWGFTIDVNNVFDVQYKNENSINQFMVTDKNIYLQTRTLLVKLSYKL